MPNPLFSPFGIGTSFAGMFLIGALEALYGPSLIRLIELFDASPSAAGFVISAHFIGGLTGVLVSQSTHPRVGNRTVLASGYLLLLVGSIGFAWAPALGLAVAASAVAGLGFGALDYAFSHLFTVAFGSGDGSGKMLNLLHGFFGLGAVLAPLAVAVFGSERYPEYFTCFALLTLLTSLGVRGVRSFPTQGLIIRTPDAAPARPEGRDKQVRLSLGFTSMVCLFVFHVAVGSGIGSWEAAYLSLIGFGAERAAAAVSLFWFSMTASRFVLGTVIRRMGPGMVVTLSCTLMVIASLLALAPGFAIAAFAVAGFALGPVFPTALVWANQLFGGRSWVSGSLIAVSMVGGIAFPPLLGATFAGGTEVSMFPLALAVLSLLCVVACLTLRIGRIREEVSSHPADPSIAESRQR